MNITNDLAHFLTNLSIFKLDDEKDKNPSYEKIFSILSNNPSVDGVSYSFEIDQGIYFFNTSILNLISHQGMLLNSSDLIYLQNNQDDILILNDKTIPKNHLHGFLPVHHMKNVKVEIYKNEKNEKIQLTGYSLSIKNRNILKKIVQQNSNSNGAGLSFLNNNFTGIYCSPPNKNDIDLYYYSYYNEFD